MPKIEYKSIRFSDSTLAVIEKANEIIDEYAADGYGLTLRQLYYQFVSRDFIRNLQSEYKRLGSIVNDGRLAGLIDWSAIEDRGRNLETIASWDEPSVMVGICADQFQVDPWEPQRNYVEVWVEKEALIGVVAVPCQEFQVPHFACKGYTSQSEMWAAGRRIRTMQRRGKRVTILHLGDHDPSGIDMTRDIQDRLCLFAESDVVSVVRLALNMDQVEKYSPPPNPAKQTDSRFEGYAAAYGNESWELDALDPKTLGAMIRREIKQRIERRLWDASLRQTAEGRALLREVAEAMDAGKMEDALRWLADLDNDR